MNALLTLGIDTSGKVASCALMDGERLLAEKILYTKLTHSQIILPMVSELMNDCGVTFGDIDAVNCAAGPGSYTGLRIGIAAVKGIVMGTPSLKCAAVSTLEALCCGCSAYQGKIVPVMYARPGIVYAGEYQSAGGRITALSEDRVVSEAEFFSELDVSGGAMLTGDRCREIKEQVWRLAEAFRREGIKPGDTVAGYLPNLPETILAMLATAAVGAVWCSCATDIGPGAAAGSGAGLWGPWGRFRCS